MHASMADVIADTAQNSIEAGASHIDVSLAEEDDKLSVTIRDNGKGMDEATIKRAFNPFYTEPGKHDKRKVGLGLPILKQICESCEGGVSLESEPGKGTTLSFHVNAKHIDLPPMGNIAEMVLTLFNYPGTFDLVFTHRKNGNDYSISRQELSEAIGGLESVEGLSLAKEFLSGQEESLV